MKHLLILLFVLFYGLAGAAQPVKKLSKPEQQFEKFWTTFRDHYAFFALKKANWDSTYTTFRPQVSKKTKEEELLAIFKQMTEPLQDGHITISKGDEVVFKVRKPSYFREEFSGQEKLFWPTVNATLQASGFNAPVGCGPIFREESLYYAAHTADLGYIRISRCFGTLESLFDESQEAADTQLMLTLFDSLLTTMAGKKALIIDLRNNGGGHGGIGLASRLVQTKTLTHYKAIRQPGSYENFTQREPQYITPNPGTQFLKPVVLLTNDRTASSAEDFTISLYRQPHVLTVGANTSGMLSDMYNAELDNGISFTLSNQRYYSVDNQILEDLGIKPDFRVLNSKADLQTNSDLVLLKALEVMLRK